MLTKSESNAYNNSKIYDYLVSIKLIFSYFIENVNNNYFFLISIVGINPIVEFYNNEVFIEIRIYIGYLLTYIILTYVLRNLFYTTILHIIYGIGKVFQ
jgi:hypothetical protein